MASKVDRQPDRLLGRRGFLSRGIVWSLGAALVGGVLVGLRTLWPRAGKASALRFDAGRPGDYTVGQVNASLLREHWVWVVRSPDGFYALSARCTHLGCRLRHDTARGRFHCNCHGSTFALDGAVQRGPAARHMERVFIALTPAGRLLVDPDLRYRHEHGEWHRPGAFVRYSTPPKRST